MTLPNASLSGPYGAVRRVRDVVPLVHRRPHRAVRRHRQALAVADPPLDDPQARPAGADGHDHRALRRHRPVVGVGVRRAAHVEVDRAVRGDRHVLRAVHVVAAGIEIRQPRGDHRAGAADPAAPPRIPVDLVRLRDVQHPPAVEPGERHALRVGQPGQQGLHGRGARRVRPQLHDLAVARGADEEVTLGRPGLHPGARHPRPNPGRPAGRDRERVRRGQRPASFSRRNGERRAGPASRSVGRGRAG